MGGWRDVKRRLDVEKIPRYQRENETYKEFMVISEVSCSFSLPYTFRAVADVWSWACQALLSSCKELRELSKKGNFVAMKRPNVTLN